MWMKSLRVANQLVGCMSFMLREKEQGANKKKKKNSYWRLAADFWIFVRIIDLLSILCKSREMLDIMDLLLMLGEFYGNLGRSNVRICGNLERFLYKSFFLGLVNPFPLVTLPLPRSEWWNFWRWLSFLSSRFSMEESAPLIGFQGGYPTWWGLCIAFSAWTLCFGLLWLCLFSL